MKNTKNKEGNMRNKFRGVLKVLLTTLCMALILSCMGIGGAHLFGLHTNNNKPIENPKQANVLSLSSGQLLKHLCILLMEKWS